MNEQPLIPSDDIQLLLATLPPTIRTPMEELPRADLLEIVLDVGRPAQARYPDRAVDLGSGPVTREHLDRVVASLGEFSGDNRAGIEGTLHRISA
ncbi:MAG TPA: single-stranded DNA-binding protein, partial [Gammaproteobacteria bacterium]|nr:single-stranded DNA-binding protein [Gammaproteobacteria bacterium]